jgi:hypothetical protein
MKEKYSKLKGKVFANVRKRKFLFPLKFKKKESTLTKRYSVTAITLHYIVALSHNASCCGEEILLLKVITLDIKEPLSLLIVIALVTF